MKYYQHRYGGIYTVDFPSVRSTLDKSEWVVYTHLWPFEQWTWIRPKDEWNDGRFIEVSKERVDEIMSGDRDLFQKQIELNKEKAKVK